MLAKRIIPCLDVKDQNVIKGKQFRNHEVIGDILELANRYSEEGADELVFYDITASSEDRRVDAKWISLVAREINIPFCVAGGIRNLKDAETILNAGADKISINSPALERPEFITELAEHFGQQCVVVGIDSFQQNDSYFVCQYTGDEKRTKQTGRNTREWMLEVQERGAGEIVLNCMNQDGMRRGYDLQQLQQMQNGISIPIVASGGAGCIEDFENVFKDTCVTGALAASVFHKQLFSIGELKQYLYKKNIEVRT